jgi:uncharacterized protein YndB with AHSA1/START domain
MKTLIIERTINAPIEKVWEAFTNPVLLKQWYSPEGATSPIFEAELKEGGRFRYSHKMDDGSFECWGRGIYEKIDAPTYLSFRDCFTDEHGNEVSSSYYGMTDSRCNEITDVLVEFFFSVDGEKTQLKMVQENPFDDLMASDMTDGWNQMFDKLGNSLK